MIAEAIRLIRDELAAYIELNQKYANADKVGNEAVILDNIATIDTDDQELSNKIILTLVNVEEESTLKNQKNYQKNPMTGAIEYIKPPVHINLYLLISSTPRKDPRDDAYELALNRLSLIIEFFQSKRSFTLFNSPGSTLVNSPFLTSEEKEKLNLTLELYTMTFEQINHLWGALGGKQMPSVMYKIRLVEIQTGIAKGGQLIEEISGIHNHKSD